MPDEKEKKTDVKSDAASDQPKKARIAVPCGHENVHWIPPKGMEGKKMTCVLERGHQPVRVVRIGPKGEDLSTYEVVHSAPYKRLVGDQLIDDIAAWTDGAAYTFDPTVPKE